MCVCVRVCVVSAFACVCASGDSRTTSHHRRGRRASWRRLCCDVHASMAAGQYEYVGVYVCVQIPTRAGCLGPRNTPPPSAADAAAAAVGHRTPPHATLIVLSVRSRERVRRAQSADAVCPTTCASAHSSLVCVCVPSTTYERTTEGCSAHHPASASVVYVSRSATLDMPGLLSRQSKHARRAVVQSCFSRRGASRRQRERRWPDTHTLTPDPPHTHTRTQIRPPDASLLFATVPPCVCVCV